MRRLSTLWRTLQGNACSLDAAGLVFTPVCGVGIAEVVNTNATALYPLGAYIHTPAKTAAAVQKVEENVQKIIFMSIHEICIDAFICLNSFVRLVQCCCCSLEAIRWLLLSLTDAAAQHIQYHQSIGSYSEVQGIPRQCASCYTLSAISLPHPLCMPYSVWMVAPQYSSWGTLLMQSHSVPACRLYTCTL